MFPDTGLTVTLTTSRGVVQSVGVRSGRLVEAASRFAGRAPAQVLTLLPNLFALCGTAQGLTGLAAMEEAAGIVCDPATRAARALMVLSETVCEHALCLTRDWPTLAGQPPDLAAAKAVKTAMAAIRTALYPDGGSLVPGGGGLRPDTASIDAAIAQATETLNRCLGADIHLITTQERRFRAWLDMATAPAASLLQDIAAQGEGMIGAIGFAPMPDDGPTDLAGRMADTSIQAYLAAPDCAGRVLETGPLSRQWGTPLVATLSGGMAPGLLARFASRLVDLAVSLRRMAALVQDLRPVPAAGGEPKDGTGLAVTQAARGLLAHRVVLSEGRVADYRILAPTEWNFHPDGPLAQGLSGMAADGNLTRRANLLVNALDPCVACEIRVETADA